MWDWRLFSGSGHFLETKVDPNHWTVFCRFLASEIPLGMSLVSITQVCFSPRDPHPVVGLRGEI